MELRYSAWTLPWDAGGFVQKIASIPVVEGTGSGTVRLNDFGSGSMSVPANYDRLPQIIASNVGSLIRVYDGTTVVHEWMAERLDYTLSEPGGVATISGSDIASAFDRAIVYPWDYNANPTIMPDWVWGGPNVLTNPGMEDNQVTGLIDDVYLGPESYELYTTATGGTFTLTAWTAETTGPINHDGPASTIASELEGLFSIVNVDVRPKFQFADLEVLVPGTSANPWVIQFIQPSVLQPGQMTVDGTGLTGGSAFLTNTLDPAIAFTLTIQSETTASIDWNDTATQVENALQALSGINDVVVSGDGRPDSPWNIKFVDPEDPYGPLTGTGTGLTIVQVQTGKSDLLAGWTKSQRADQRAEPQYHGLYTIFRQSSGAEPVHSGSFSLVVSGTQYAGAQQVVNVNPGGLYQASIWVRTNASNQTFRLVLRDIYEEILNVQDDAAPWSDASVEVTPAADTWTQLVIPNVLMETYQFGFAREQAVFRIANVTANPAGIWYFDDAELSLGLAPDYPGGIARDLMNDAVSRSILDWVDYGTLNSQQDTDGTAWPTLESFTAYRGATYGQTWDSLTNLENEWRLPPKSTPVGALTHDLQWYVKGGLGTDYTTAATPAINVGQGVMAAKIVRRLPAWTHTLVEGGDGIWVEDNDATLATNFGRAEKYRGDTGIGEAAALGQASDKLLYEATSTTLSLQVTIQATLNHAHLHPLVAYTVGDELYVQLPPQVSKVAKRVTQISYQNSKPTMYQVTLVEPPV